MVIEPIILEQMKSIRLKDKRLNKRCFFSQTQLLQRGSHLSFPKVFKNQYELKGFYRFLSHDAVDSSSLIGAYRRGLNKWAKSLTPCTKPARVFLFQDSTFGKYGGRKLDLGYLETGQDNGLLIHNGILTDGDFVPLGLPVQQFIQRSRTEFGKSRTRQKRAFEEKESYKWTEGFDWALEFQRSSKIPVIQVFDKEADIAELFNYALERKQHFVVNARNNRRLLETEQTLFEYLRQLAPAAIVKRPILNKNGKEFLLDCSINFAQLSMQAVDEPLWAIRLFQMEPIEQQAPAEWFLVTTLPVNTVEQAVDVVDIYSKRWRTCEDFHKCLKTGCAIEERQLGSANALINAIALLSLVAIALLRTRHLSFSMAQAPADQILSEDELQVATIADQKFLMPIDRTLCKQGSVLWLILLLGRMGGHQGLKQAGMPGWQSIWAGWNYFQTLVDGFIMSKNFFPRPPTYG